MSYIGTDGVEHPHPSDTFTSEGLDHIRGCVHCTKIMPSVADIARHMFTRAE